MQIAQFRHYILLLKRLGIVMGLFTLCRILFFLFNYQLFSDISFLEFLKVMVFGWRFDLSAIFYINTLFILLHIIPNPWRDRKAYQRVLKTLFYAVNGIALFFEASDFIYYKFAQQRTSSHILGLKNDILGLIPQFIHDFWYVLLICAVVVYLIERLYRKTASSTVAALAKPNYLIQSITAIIIAGLWLLAGRGGLQLKPISPITATKYLRVNDVSLITNTSFTIIYSMFHRELEIPEYFPENQLVESFNPAHELTENGSKIWADTLRKSAHPNVVILLLESFSKEYTGYFNDGDGYTPFLDSLMKQSMVFTQAYANGKHSIDALPAITIGLPALMNDAYISSIYSTNRIEGLGKQLQEIGYTSYFMHGGNNGTMTFDYYADAVGIDHYIGRDEYNNDADFDGNWGIFDEPFLQYVDKVLDSTSKPFCSIIFTLSSHHPFTIPKKYKGRFKEGPLPIIKSVSYADYALQQFFKTASKMDWFDNTLFLISPDHTGPLMREENKNRVGNYRIPIIAYLPGSNLKGSIDYTVQQLDIYNTILEFTGYTGRYVSFGNSLFDPDAYRYSVSQMDDIYQIIHHGYALQFDGSKVVGYFNCLKDPTLSHNLTGSSIPLESEMLTKLKLIIQTYDEMLVNNKYYPE